MADYATILVSTDFSDQARAGVDEAAKLADRLGSRLILLYAVEDQMPPVLDGVTWARAMEHHREVASQHLAELAKRQLGDRNVETVVETGRPHEVIVTEAKKRGADLIVMASHGYGLVGRTLLGSTAQRVLHHAPCPVLIVHADKE